MKFFWKIYFSFTVLFLLAFGLFGTWMIQMTFRQSYQKVLENGEWDNRMYQLTFETNLNSMSDEMVDDGVIPVVAATVLPNLSRSGSIYRIYNAERTLLYESQSSNVRNLEALKMLSDSQCCYSVQRSDGQTWLLFVCRSSVRGTTYILENLTNISDIYEQRETYYDWYGTVMMLMTGLVTGLVVLISHMLTHSIRSLSQVTRRLTGGDLSARAEVQGADEIADLAVDFNRMAAVLTAKMEELREQAKRQEDFTASFAHELKTPLTSIIGYSDMLRSMDCSKEETMEAANYIFQQGKRLESLSFRLLELIVMEKQELDMRFYSISHLTEEALHLTEQKRTEKEIAVRLEVEDAMIFGESDLLISLLVNLLDNARKALQPEGEIRIIGRKYPRHYLLCIEDNGCGIRPEDLTRITEAFYMADKSRSRKEGGAGLGMTLCSRIVDRHHVGWKIFSKPGKGTAVVIRFLYGEDTI